MDNDKAILNRALELWRQGSEPAPDAVKWARENARIDMWSKQRDICQSVQDNKFTAVKSCHGIGKSFTASTLACWWVDTHPINDTMVVTTAPSKDQVSGILWQNMMKIHRRANLKGEVLGNDEWKIGGLQVGIGRKPHDYNQATFQGYHRRYLLVILDEAAGIPEWIWESANNLVTGDDCRILAIGNPTDSSSRFKKVCDPGSGWNVITVSFFDSPAWTGEVVSSALKAELVTKKWMEDKKSTYGDDSPEWEARVIAQFPTKDDAAVIPYAWVEAARNRHKEWVAEGMPLPKGKKIIACDVAREGRDKTVIVKRIQHVCWGLEEFAKRDTEETADLLMNRANKDLDMVTVDATGGLGAGVGDKLRRRGWSVRFFTAQARTNATDRTGEWSFDRVRTAALWNLRELLDPANGHNIIIPDDEELAADLIAPKWKEVLGARIWIEPKEDIKARTKRSPDKGDAVAIAFWYVSGVAVDSPDLDAIDWSNMKTSDGAIDWEIDNDLKELFNLPPGDFMEYN